jgi:hypothetical protein
MGKIDFFEKNKQSLLSEIGTTIQESNNILNDIINNKNKKSKPSDIKLLIALGHKLGYLSGVYSQLYTTSNIKELSEDETKVGFIS